MEDNGKHNHDSVPTEGGGFTIADFIGLSALAAIVAIVGGAVAGVAVETYEWVRHLIP